MPALVLPARASSENVALAFLATLPGITSAMVAAVLPADTSKWASTGFITATPVAGLPGIDIPTRHPLVQVDCWAVKPGAQRPPWGQVDQLTEAVVAGCQAARPVTLTVTAGASTAHARMLGVWVATEPMRLYSDDSSYARKRLDLRLDWV